MVFKKDFYKPSQNQYCFHQAGYCVNILLHSGHSWVSFSRMQDETVVLALGQFFSIIRYCLSQQLYPIFLSHHCYGCILTIHTVKDFMGTFLSLDMICFCRVSLDSHSHGHQHVRTLACHICLQPSDQQALRVSHSYDHELASYNFLAISSFPVVDSASMSDCISWSFLSVLNAVLISLLLRLLVLLLFQEASLPKVPAGWSSWISLSL